MNTKRKSSRVVNSVAQVLERIGGQYLHGSGFEDEKPDEGFSG